MSVCGPSVWRRKGMMRDRISRCPFPEVLCLVGSRPSRQSGTRGKSKQGLLVGGYFATWICHSKYPSIPMFYVSHLIPHIQRKSHYGIFARPPNLRVHTSHFLHFPNSQSNLALLNIDTPTPTRPNSPALRPARTHHLEARTRSILPLPTVRRDPCCTDHDHVGGYDARQGPRRSLEIAGSFRLSYTRLYA